MHKNYCCRMVLDSFLSISLNKSVTYRQTVWCWLCLSGLKLLQINVGMGVSLHYKCDVFYLYFGLISCSNHIEMYRIWNSSNVLQNIAIKSFAHHVSRTYNNQMTSFKMVKVREKWCTFDWYRDATWWSRVLGMSTGFCVCIGYGECHYSNDMLFALINSAMHFSKQIDDRSTLYRIWIVAHHRNRICQHFIIFFHFFLHIFFFPLNPQLKSWLSWFCTFLCVFFSTSAYFAGLEWFMDVCTIEWQTTLKVISIKRWSKIWVKLWIKWNCIKEMWHCFRWHSVQEAGVYQLFEEELYIAQFRIFDA